MIQMIPTELTEDLKILEERGYQFEIKEENNKVHVIFKDFPLPSGVYNMEKTELLIFTTPHYPNAGFDMFWVDEGLRLNDDRIPEKAEQIEVQCGVSRRRFSYHPYNAKPWNPSEDNVVHYMEYVHQRLRNGN